MLADAFQSYGGPMQVWSLYPLSYNTGAKLLFSEYHYHKLPQHAVWIAEGSLWIETYTQLKPFFTRTLDV